MRKMFLTGMILAAFGLFGCDKSEDAVVGPGGGGGGGGDITGSAISLGRVDGLSGSGTIYSGQTVRIHFVYTNNTSAVVAGFTNGYKVYSPDGAVWTVTTAGATGAITSAMFEIDPFFSAYSIDGAGVDTIGIGAFRIAGSGLPVGFDDEAFWIEIGPVSAADAGKRICIDSTWYRPSNPWLWSHDGNLDSNPSWDGPHCWTVTN